MVPSPSRTCLLAGRTATSLASINEVPARTSTSRFSTTRPSKAKLCLPRVNERRVSPRTLRGEEPSAWWADWKVDSMWAWSALTRERRIILTVAPLSIVMRTGVWP